MSMPVSQFITPPPPPCHFPPLSQLLPCKPVHLYHFSRFHIYALIYDICFSLSDLLHSVWHSLDPFMSLQMTQFCSFLWLSNTPLYICTTTSLSICLSMGICFFGERMSSLEKCLFRSSVHFWIGLFVFLILSCMCCLYILEINPLSVASFANIFSHSEGCLFVLFMVSFAVQKLWSFIRSHLFIFVFISIILGGGSKNIFLWFMSKSVLPKRYWWNLNTTYIQKWRAALNLKIVCSFIETVIWPSSVNTIKQCVDGSRWHQRSWTHLLPWTCSQIYNYKGNNSFRKVLESGDQSIHNKG